MENNFLLITFPAGAGGKFLASVLMGNPDVAHFDPDIEKNKTYSKSLAYIQRSFTHDKTLWLLNEPSQTNAWNLHFISSKYDRGDELSCDEFDVLCEQHGSDHFKNMVKLNKKILLPWHKTTVPKFFEYSQKITILLTPDSMEWFDRALWEKHYVVEKNRIKINMHDPSLNPKFKYYFDKFKNNMYSDDPVDVFYRDHIVNNVNKKIFNSELIFSNQKNNIFITLSDLLSLKSFELAIRKIENAFLLKPLDKNFITAAHTHWRDLHDY